METMPLFYLPSLLRYLPKKFVKPFKWGELLTKYYPTTFFPPCMTAKENYLFRKYIKLGKNVVEFGAGGSTFLFLEQGKIVFSVESDLGFINYLKTIPLIQKKLSQKKLCLYHANLGETIKWGRPKDRTSEGNWPSYYKAVWENFNVRNPDIVFIDGRFRIMCALHSITYINQNTVVLMHDFFRRKHYNVILDFFEVVDTVDFLVILKIKKKIDLEHLKKVKSEHQFDYR